MPDFLASLSQGFMPHGFCLRWDTPLLVVFVAANIGIALAYFAIPLALRYFVGKRRDLPYAYMFYLFAAFITSCGITHLAKVWTIYQPAYWAEALIDLWTALISLATAVLLYPLIPKALALRSPIALAEANQQLEAMNKQLAVVNDELAMVNGDLKIARDQAVEASSLKSAFIANMSHELRTPLSGVLGMNELLLNSPLTEEQARLARTVQDSARSLLSIVNDILDLSKIEAGKMSLENVPVDPGNIVTDAMQVLTAAAKTKGLSLECKIDPNVPELVFGDPVRTHQVLLNLLGNAVKFTSRGAVTANVFLESEDDFFANVKFEIIDTGIGISDDDRRFLFMPFTQIDRSTTRIYGGTGLGLNISKRLVELMAGEIGVDSKKGSGSTFWFTVPFKKKGIVVDKSADESRRNIFCQGEILVVEDHPALQELVDLQLAHLGLAHKVVSTAEEGLELIKSNQYRAIFMDCHLPHMDGYDATRSIREMERATGMHIPIIAMTAGAMKGDPEKCLAAGMDDYLAKPYTIEQLRDKLSRWIPEQSTPPS